MNWIWSFDPWISEALESTTKEEKISQDQPRNSRAKNDAAKLKEMKIVPSRHLPAQS